MSQLLLYLKLYFN